MINNMTQVNISGIPFFITECSVNEYLEMIDIEGDPKYDEFDFIEASTRIVANNTYLFDNGKYDLAFTGKEGFELLLNDVSDSNIRNTLYNRIIKKTSDIMNITNHTNKMEKNGLLYTVYSVAHELKINVNDVKKMTMNELYEWIGFLNYKSKIEQEAYKKAMKK